MSREDTDEDDLDLLDWSLMSVDLLLIAPRQRLTRVREGDLFREATLALPIFVLHVAFVNVARIPSRRMISQHQQPDAETPRSDEEAPQTPRTTSPEAELNVLLVTGLASFRWKTLEYSSV